MEILFLDKYIIIDLYNAVLADIQYHVSPAYEDKDKAVALAVKMNAKAEILTQTKSTNDCVTH